MVRQFWTNLIELDILTILCVLAAVGFIGVIYDLCLLIKRKNFGELYFSKFNEFVVSGPHEMRHYQWLLYNLARMQSEMRGYGRADLYKPPFANYAFRDYDMLPNTLLNITPYPHAELEVTQSILQSYIGALDSLVPSKLWEVINPLVWLTRGVRVIIFDTPLWILQSVGLISGSTGSRIGNSALIGKIIGGLTLLSMLVSLIAGWDSFVEFLNRIFGWVSSVP